jgi:hypothetical protein
MFTVTVVVLLHMPRGVVRWSVAGCYAVAFLPGDGFQRNCITAVDHGGHSHELRWLHGCGRYRRSREVVGTASGCPSSALLVAAISRRSERRRTFAWESSRAGFRSSGGLGSFASRLATVVDHCIAS